jgi:hypothetical protein
MDAATCLVGGFLSLLLSMNGKKQIAATSQIKSQNVSVHSFMIVSPFTATCHFARASHKTIVREPALRKPLR